MNFHSKFVFNTSNSLRDMANESFYQKQIVNQAAFFRSKFFETFLAKTTTVQRINAILPQLSTSCRPIRQVGKVIAEDVSRAREFRNCMRSAPINFCDSSRAVLYAANREFFSNACKRLMLHTIKNPQHGMRAQMLLKLTNRLQMAEIKTDSRIDV